MKILIILAILAVAYLVYRSLTADVTPTATPVEKPAAEEVSMPNAEFKDSIRIAAVTVTVAIVLLITAAFLL